MHKNGRPYYLPQISAPYNIVLDKLNDDNIGYNIIRFKPNDNDKILPSQKVIYSDIIEKCEINNNNPIWLSTDNDVLTICDGHHRYFKALYDNVPILGIVLNFCFNDACRILNKIQDIFDYEKSKSIENDVNQNIIDLKQDDENQFLNALEEHNGLLGGNKNNKKIIAYRKGSIIENSVIGNFFCLNPIKGYDKYEIEFDNLLDVKDLGVKYRKNEKPVDILCNIWFPHINFNTLASKYNVSLDNLKYKTITEFAKKLGYDGVKYDDNLIQGFK